jgi:hypothetical protein
MPPYDLVIALRAYPGISKRPLLHRDSKPRLLELSIRSLVKAVGDLKVKFHVLLDRETPELREVVTRCLEGYESEIEVLPGVGNFESFRRLLEVATTQDAADLVMLAEDDYLYAEGAVVECVRLLERDQTVDFATPFRHVTYQASRGWARPPSPLESDKAWEAAPYTTLTFMARTTALRVARRGFLSFTYHNFDAVLWMQLTGTCRPWGLASEAARRRDPLLLKFLLKRLLYRPMFLGIPAPMRLCVPARSLATHLESTDVDDPERWLGIARELG